MRHKSESSGMAMGLLLGIGIGAAAGLLFAPRRGEETRAQIRQKAIKTGTMMRQQMAGHASKAKEVIDRTADKSKAVASRAEQTIAGQGEERLV